MKKIKIGWKEYEIIKTKPDSRLMTGSECFGYIGYNDLKIYIDETATERQQATTLIHEILHGIDNMYYFDFEEEVITRLANAIYTVLIDNGLELTKS